MNHINIITQEEITAVPIWPVILVGGITIAALIGMLIYIFVVPQNVCKLTNAALCVGFGGLITMLITAVITSTFFQIPTGRYKYEATIDKDKITVAEYEQFIEEYNPTIKDGIYYWEDKAE